MLQPQADLYFLRPFFRAGFRKLAFLTFFLGFIFNLFFNIPAAQADDPYYITVQDNPHLTELKQQLDQLQIQDNTLADMEKMFRHDSRQSFNYIYTLFADSGLIEDNLAKLATKRNEISEAKNNLQQQIQALEKRLKVYAVAEKVRAAPNPDDYRQDRYDRIGYRAGIKSDCTWYAAEALKLASQGKIDLNNRDSIFGNWGNGGNWAAHAAAFLKNNPDGPITGIDKIPSPGDIIEWPDHLAFVEKVQDIKDEQGNLVRYAVTISEEIATGVGRKDSTPVKPDDDFATEIKRWRITLEFNLKNGQEVDAKVSFIHFNF